MKVVATIAAVRAARPELGRLGLVPTMGFLHAGHLALAAQARAECEAVAVSIFVNPSQFGPNEDLARYPRDMEHDLALLEAGGVDLVFVPAVNEMYPAGFTTWVDVEQLSAPLEGAHRPGHFRGVATVVCKLLNIMMPERVYFGAKDAQQTVVVRRMVSDLALPSEVVVVPTVRETDGLALSSRNIYLDPAQRQAAGILYRALTAGRQAWLAGECNAQALRQLMVAMITAEPLAQIDYVSLAEPETLVELDAVADRALASLAVRFGTTRLIDNLIWERRAAAW
ncbi:MAG: pantoate--beta-alanine ligase [Herpetosiphonaceae bacterium]|nr:pantoate--beta-alanine ligase [Herpetosiphonaceae bacterium]